MKPARRETDRTGLRIDRAEYLVDDVTRTYTYLRRNLAWRDLDPDENERNKRHLDGYTRILPDGSTRVFRYRPPRERRPPEAAVDRTADVAGLHRTVQSLASFARSAPPTEPLADGWGVHEVLAHLVFWHEHYGRLLRAELTGGEPPALAGTFVELNAVAVRRFANEPTDALAGRLVSAQAELVRLAADARVGEIHVRIKAGGKQWPWPDFVRRVEGHIRGHEAELARRLRRGARRR